MRSVRTVGTLILFLFATFAFVSAQSFISFIRFTTPQTIISLKTCNNMAAMRMNEKIAKLLLIIEKNM